MGQKLVKLGKADRQKAKSKVVADLNVKGRRISVSEKARTVTTPATSTLYLLHPVLPPPFPALCLGTLPCTYCAKWFHSLPVTLLWAQQYRFTHSAHVVRLCPLTKSTTSF